MKKNVGSVLWKAFLAVYAILLTTVIVLCVMKTQENVPANLMTWYPFAGILLITVLAFLGIKIEAFLEKYERYLLLIFLYCMWCLLLDSSCILVPIQLMTLRVLLVEHIIWLV